MLADADRNIVWEPIPDSSQEFAIDTRCDHTLFHGTRGPGKTITQLMRYRRFVGLGYGSFWRGVILDKEFKNLSDLVSQSKRFFSKFNDGAKFHESASEFKWVWPTGEELLFRHAKKISDYENFHGHEYPFIGWNELTKHSTPELYDKLMSCNRSSFVPELHTPKDEKGEYLTWDKKPLPRIPLQVFSTTNPSGPGHNWVKRRFINCAENGEVVRTRVTVYNPKTKSDEIVEKTQVAIFGSYRENIYLDVSYIAELDLLTKNNYNLRRAWLFGDWNVTAGGAIDDVWNSERNIVPRFKIPATWYVDRSFDWGSTHPFSVGWWAEADGTEVELPDGRKFCPPAKSLIRIFEWYGAQEIGLNKGLKLSAKEIAKGIIEREKELKDGGWVASKINPGPADNQINSNIRINIKTIADEMKEEKVTWTESDKSPGSRIMGLEIVRTMIAEASKDNPEGPALYIMRVCEAAIETLPPLPRDEKKLDDVDTDSEDHIYDEVRYRALAIKRNVVKSAPIRFG